jgi:hypothetical protein
VSNYGESHGAIPATRGKPYKTVHGRNLRIFVVSYSDCPLHSFQPILMFVGKARSPLLSGAPIRCYVGLAPALPANIRLGWKASSETNALAYYEKA